jgi:hypothetical protein
MQLTRKAFMQSALLACTALFISTLPAQAASGSTFSGENMLHLTQEWDKTFPQSSKVDHRKVSFHNRYGITLAADLTCRKTVASRNWPPLPSAAPLAP